MFAHVRAIDSIETDVEIEKFIYLVLDLMNNSTDYSLEDLDSQRDFMKHVTQLSTEWKAYKKDRTNYIKDVRNILDKAVYGLNDAKMQIMQLIGQWIVNPAAVGSAIAIKGPMGTGKTTLV